jgi:phosphoesterase RecJ-like protein
MAYTYINRNDLENWSNSEINEAFMFFKNNIIRFIQGVHWGFMIKPSREEPNNWWLSFRSTKGYQEVDKIAEKLGGGGHMYASGAKLEYSENRSLEQVLTDVVTVIKDITTS